MKQDEAELIIQVLNGNHDHYGVLIDRYKDGLYRHCFRFVRDEDTAEDLAQEAFIQAFLQLKKYDQQHRFSTWLYKIATNIALQYVRRRQPLRLEDAAINAILSTLPATDQLAKDNELHAAVDKLSPKYKQAVTLHYLQGKNYQYIAKKMSTTTGTVKSWIYRAKQQLKEMLS
jgi:RNA polymerase sigma-70 factor (ECF subfamily)